MGNLTTSLEVQILLLTGIVAILLSIFNFSNKTSFQKVAGVLLITAFAFQSGHFTVFLISVFVVATLVTNLEFLEKIAAIIWNSEGYWKYKLGKSTDQEIKDKVEKETLQELRTNSISDISEKTEKINDSLSFEKKAISILAKTSGLVWKEKIENDVKLQAGKNTYFIDAIADAGWTIHIFEIKAIGSPSSLENASQQVRKYADAYINYLKAKKIRKFVRPVLVLPSTEYDKDEYDGIPLVRIDLNSDSVANKENVMTLLSGNMMQYADWD